MSKLTHCLVFSAVDSEPVEQCETYIWSYNQQEVTLTCSSWQTGNRRTLLNYLCPERMFLLSFNSSWTQCRVTIPNCPTMQWTMTYVSILLLIHSLHQHHQLFIYQCKGKMLRISLLYSTTAVSSSGKVNYLFFFLLKWTCWPVSCGMFGPSHHSLVLTRSQSALMK